MIKKYIIAVSGGPDSMALLHKKKRLVKAVCHVNYHDREDTDNDERIVKTYCNKYNIPLYIIDTKKNNMQNYFDIKNPQTYYRKIRYDFFIEIANKLGIKKCLIGHHKNDVLESAFMQIEKNKKNLYLGIRKKSYYQSLLLMRPLLNKTKKELELYCKKKQIDYAVDYSNFSDIYERNVTRKKLNSYSKKELKKFYWKIKMNNFKNYFLILKINSEFKQWKKSDFSRIYFLNQNKKYKNHLIFLLLNFLNIVPNENKINQIIDFIEKNKNNPSKKYRLKNKEFLEVINNQLKYIKS